MANLLDHVTQELETLRADGLYKVERPLLSPQSGGIDVNTADGPRQVINLCANNYLGLADHPALVSAAKQAMDSHGYGMASVRFICGTQDLHLTLEKAIADFLEMEDSILFAACFDANGGLFEPLLGPEDAIISDSLNHASIIDGVRLCKARRFRFANNDMADLEAKLKEAEAGGARFKIVATDGVFSMDGYIANLKEVRALCDQYGALLMVDDCHSTGVLGPQGRGTAAHCGVKADILTGTLGKALGGAMGGYIAAAGPIIELLRQRARPYLFSNALTPALVGGALKALELVRNGDDLRARLHANAQRFRKGMTQAGFTLLPGEHPIIPVMLGEAPLAQEMAARLYDRGVYVTGFFFPVVPKGQARIRTQMNAALTPAQIDQAIAAFTEVGKELGVI
ncbi:glycine C-acetyltransferase [Rhodovibrionaceae bacterium A322]